MSNKYLPFLRSHLALASPNLKKSHFLRRIWTFIKQYNIFTDFRKVKSSAKLYCTFHRRYDANRYYASCWKCALLNNVFDFSFIIQNEPPSILVVALMKLILILQVICHGIPDMRPLQNGDICNVDVTVYHRYGAFLNQVPNPIIFLLVYMFLIRLTEVRASLTSLFNKHRQWGKLPHFLYPCNSIWPLRHKLFLPRAKSYCTNGK